MVSQVLFRPKSVFLSVFNLSIFFFTSIFTFYFESLPYFPNQAKSVFRLKFVNINPYFLLNQKLSRLQTWFQEVFRITALLSYCFLCFKCQLLLDESDSRLS